MVCLEAWVDIWGIAGLLGRVDAAVRAGGALFLKMCAGGINRLHLFTDQHAQGRFREGGVQLLQLHRRNFPQ